MPVRTKTSNPKALFPLMQHAVLLPVIRITRYALQCIWLINDSDVIYKFRSRNGLELEKRLSSCSSRRGVKSSRWLHGFCTDSQREFECFLNSHTLLNLSQSQANAI